MALVKLVSAEAPRKPYPIWKVAAEASLKRMNDVLRRLHVNGEKKND
jgi:hypothetical protein